jgi:SAM-dependent methyltransferase
MRYGLVGLGIALGLALQVIASGQEIGSPEGIRTEQSLPSRYPYVVDDALKFCNPEKGFWIDLGAGKGQLTIPLVEKMGNPVVMLDPDTEALAEGLQIAREKGLEDKLMAVVGVAEDLPFPDNSVDLVVSRGSIFFWDDPGKGLREVYRVLRPGAKAYIGGGAGSGYPDEAAKKLIEQRKKKTKGDEAEKWNKFIELRRPEQMQKWAEDAGLPEFVVMGRGAISAEDERVGQGVWLQFEKKPEIATRKAEDVITTEVKDDSVVYTISSPSGIGAATIMPWNGWPKKVVLKLRLRGLESLRVVAGEIDLRASLQSHGEHRQLLTVTANGQEKTIEESDIQVLDASGKPVQGLPGEGGCFEIELPGLLFEAQPKSMKIDWIDFYRQ